MSTGSTGQFSLFSAAWAILVKDIRSEFRTRVALNSILLFSVTTMLIVGFAAASGEPPPMVKIALFWVTLFFAAFSGLSHVFIHETETGSEIALRMAAPPGAVLAGKLCFNLLLTAVIAVVIGPLFWLMLGLSMARPFALIAVLAAGAISLCAAATIVAAILAKAGGKGALFGALGFPILMPLMLVALHATRLTLIAEIPTDVIAIQIGGLLAYGIMIIAMSAILFPFIWDQ